MAVSESVKENGWAASLLPLLERKVQALALVPQLLRRSLAVSSSSLSLLSLGDGCRIQELAVLCHQT